MEGIVVRLTHGVDFDLGSYFLFRVFRVLFRSVISFALHDSTFMEWLYGFTFLLLSTRDFNPSVRLDMAIFARWFHLLCSCDDFQFRGFHVGTVRYG
jgi:hypothetical protein